jgi:hypothetical protein
MSLSGQHDSGIERADRIEGALVDLAASAKDLPTKRQVSRVATESRRRSSIAVLLSSLLSAAIALTALGWSSINSHAIADNTAKAAITDQSIHSLQDANEKLAARGLPQIPVPQQGQQIDINGLVNSVSALVLADVERDPRFKGPQGATGATGHEGPTGDTGEPGKSGSEGPGGLNGETPVPTLTAEGHLVFTTSLWVHDLGSVIGPKGEKGDKGDQGEQGLPGPVCPVDFEPQKFWVDTYSNDQVLTAPARRLVALCVPTQ